MLMMAYEYNFQIDTICARIESESGYRLRRVFWESNVSIMQYGVRTWWPYSIIVLVFTYQTMQTIMNENKFALANGQDVSVAW